MTDRATACARTLLVLAALVIPATACLDAQPPAGCAPGNGGITLPPGFCASVFAEGLGAARHIAVAPNGDVFVAVSGRRGGGGGTVALRDTDSDGRADVRESFGVAGGNGIALGPGFLYHATDDAVLRYRLPAGSLRPSGRPDTIVSGLPVGGHRTKSVVLADGGRTLFVGVGSMSNSCQVEDRAEGSRGRDPCPELATRAGVWRFDATRLRQKQSDGRRYATGLRNPVALGFAPDGSLYAAPHGRDQLFQNWPRYYDARRGAELPAEELVRIAAGDDFGWPYCYYDGEKSRKVLAPEYGGDGERVGRCARAKDPVVAFPGHWAPIGLTFYQGTLFPARYLGGVFVTFHGSWNRAPLPQGGFQVAFVPMRGGRPAGPYETFADGFAGATKQPGGADHRPTGIAVAPDGALFIADDAGGRIWRVVYTRSRG